MTQGSHSFWSRLIASSVIFSILSPSPVQAALQRRRAVQLLVDLERIYADVAGTKEQAEQAQRIGLEYVRNCNEIAEACEQALALALAEQGYPEASIRNFGHLVAEGRRISQAVDEYDRARSLSAELANATPTGEAFDAGGVLVWGWVAGIALAIWGFKTDRKVVGIIGIGIVIGLTPLLVRYANGY